MTAEDTLGRAPPAWLPGRTWYQLHALRAAACAGTNPDAGAKTPTDRGFQRLQVWLDHVAGLGSGGVLLTPISASMTHGYDTVDPLRVDQRLGDESDFEAFVDAAHALDLKVALDGVFNHVGRDFPRFRDVLARGRDSEYTDWFRLDFTRDEGDGFAYACFEGHRELVALNHDNDAVLDWASEVARHWLERGADGWRFDAAYAMSPAFVASLTERVLAQHPQAFMFGEMIHGDYAGFVTSSGLHSVTQYELYKAIWSSLNDANLFELAWALERHDAFARVFVPVTFAGNHDVTRLHSILHDPSLVGPALAILFTVPGTPCVYYGDELAWEGIKEQRAGGDDAIRPPLPRDPTPAGDEQERVLQLHRELIALRRARPWLTTAHIDVVEVANQRITYTVAAGSNALLVTLDVGASPLVPPPGGWQPIASGAGWLVCERAAA
ncbi:MAG: cyclomaltodextrinase / maltogenic alpha-amylase / neopullulanase [Actinomycetota bacterium]|nr:cyclomaltodextrinase / maltogenic alpha-amylase / neopullulanase [Actinomycetota bacterium]